MRGIAYAALAAIVVGCGPSAVPENRAQKIAEPSPVKVVRRDIVGYVIMPGDIFVPADADATVSAPYRAPVEKVMAAVGQRVRKGEVLFDLSLPEAEGAYEASRSAIKEAETALANAKAQYEAPVKQYQLAADQARSRERTLRQYAKTSGDASQLEQATAERVAAEQALTQARAEARTQIQPYQQQYDEAVRAFRQNRSSVKEGSVHAPISGTVLEMNVKPGQEVGVGNERLARVVDLGEIQVKSKYGPDADPWIKEGRDVVVTFAELKDKPFDGRVSRIRTIPGNGPGNSQHEATIDFRNDLGEVKPGMKVASVGVKTGKETNVLSVPVEAVAKDSTGKPYVNRLDGQNWTKTVVELGLSDGTNVAIKSGLKEGDTVQVPPQGSSS